MPELPFHTNDSRELIKDKWFDMDAEQRTAKMAFSGTRSLLLWCRQQTEGYNEVNVYNMSSSWRDGLAFCAIIHHYRPDLIDFDRLSKENILENNELAFSMAEKHFGIPLVLDASDMIENPNPDRLSIITYVSQLYEYFKNKTPANQGYSTKMNIQPKARSESTGHKGSKRTSPSHQARILSGHAKRVASALRNVFKSDTKEEQSKSKEQGPSSKYLSVDAMRTTFDASRNSEENSPSAAKKSPFLGNDCFVCHNRVFLMERLIAERKLFHRACFKCDKCSACLRPGTYHYCPETDRFCCLFDCTGAQRKKPITIKFEPLTDVSQEPHSQQNLSPKSSPDLSNRTAKPTDSDEKVKSPLQRQFSVVKKNAITLPALPAISQRKASASKSPKSPRSSNKSKTSQGQKGEGQKKRRFSAGRRVKGKLERTPKVKSVDTAEPGELEKTWSPLNKRRAPDTNLVEKSNNVENNDGDNVTNEISHEDAPRVVSMSMSSTKSDFLSDEEQEEGKQTDFQNNDQKRTPKEAPANLFFSFKEELLKRATESNVTEENKLLNGCEHKPSNDKAALDVDGKEKGESENDLKLDSGSDLNWDKDNERKCSVDTSSVNSDSTKSMGSQKTSMSDEIERPVAPKSVQRLRQKFLNIDDMIDEKHKNNLARKTHEIQRELRCISAWKQQTDSHVATSRKLSIHSAGKSVESKKPNLGGSRRSVKELRKMYMEGGKAGKRKLFAESLASRERTLSEPERTDTTSDDVRDKLDSNEAETEDRSASSKDVDKSLQTDNGDEPSANKDIDNSSTTVDDNNSRQSNHVDNSPESKDVEDTFPQSREVVDLTRSRDVVSVEEDTRNDSNEPCDKANHTVVINIEHNEGKIDSYSDANNNESQPSSDNVRGLCNETRTFTIINSDDVSHEVPSLHIEPASPQSSNGERRSPGLKRHAASHDSGIDMPSYMQSNLLGSSPDDKTSGGNLKVAAEFSFPGSGTTVLTPSEQFSNEAGTDVQASNPPLSPGSDGSPEVLWSLPLSTGNRSSLTDSSSSCSSPRMSIIIAQEASTTKINSRFFTVETMEPWDFENHRIAEEHQCVMEVEGEFSFGREKSKTSRAEREAIFSLRGDARSGNFNSTDLIKEEEITLSPSEIDSELQSLDALHRELERRGVEIEHSLRECMQCERPFNDCEDELLREWLSVVHERNMILRRESELIYLLQSHNYEERYRTVEGELRKLVAMRDEVKSSDDLKRERELLSELLELVQKRSFIVDSLEEERVREIHEDEKVEQALTDGIAALPNNRWSQRPDCTKVAFSRFYC